MRFVAKLMRLVAKPCDLYIPENPVLIHSHPMPHDIVRVRNGGVRKECEMQCHTRSDSAIMAKPAPPTRRVTSKSPGGKGASPASSSKSSASKPSASGRSAHQEKVERRMDAEVAQSLKKKMQARPVVKQPIVKQQVIKQKGYNALKAKKNEQNKTALQAIEDIMRVSKGTKPNSNESRQKRLFQQQGYRRLRPRRIQRPGPRRFKRLRQRRLSRIQRQSRRMPSQRRSPRRNQRSPMCPSKSDRLSPSSRPRPRSRRPRGATPVSP